MRPFLVCFEAHRPDGLVWAVRQRGTWRLSAAVDIRVPVRTVYKGPEARQPKAYLTGVGRVTGNRRTLTISRARKE